MIRLPNLQPSNPNQTAVSAQAIAAPAAALQDISQGLAYTGQALNSQALRIQNIENARLESETRQQWNRRTAELDNKLKTTSDPTAYNTLTQQLLDELKSELDNTELPPVVANRLQLQFSDFSTRATISAAERSSNLAISRAQKAFQNEIETATYTGDRNAFNNAIETARQGFGLTPEDEEAMSRNFDQNIEFQSLKLQAQDAPDNALQDLESEDFQALYPNLTPQQRDQLKTYAKQQQKIKFYEQIDTVEDDIASGNITDPSQIDALTSLRPSIRESLKARLANRNDDKHQARLRDPEYQNQLIGQASAMLKSYDPTGQDFDSGYVAVDSVIRQLPPSAIRDELEKSLNAKRTGEERRIETLADQALAAAQDHYDTLASKIPSAETTFSTSRAINEGFLRNPAKLLDLGFNAEQSAYIIGNFFDKESDSERKKRFQSIAFKREGENKADAWTQTAAEAILNGKSSFKVLDREAEEKRILAEKELTKSRGKTLRTLSEWLTITGGNATEDQINAKLQELAGKDARAKLQSGVFEEMPTLPDESESSNRIPGPTGSSDLVLPPK